MTDSALRLRVVASTPISEELIGRVVAAEPRIDFIRDQALLPPMRFPGDHSGDPAFRRSAAEQRRFEELIDSADALYGVPDCDPASLARVVNASSRLRWVQTMAAGGGAKVKAAKLTDEQLRRVAFSTSAGVHARPLAEYAVFGLLAGAKTLPRLLAQQQQHHWARRWTMKQLAGQRILIVGLGNIGRATALMLKALGATVVGTSRHGQAIEGVDEIIRMDQLADAAEHADGIVVALPGTDCHRQAARRRILRRGAAGRHARQRRSGHGDRRGGVDSRPGRRPNRVCGHGCLRPRTARSQQPAMAASVRS